MTGPWCKGPTEASIFYALVPTTLTFKQCISRLKDAITPLYSALETHIWNPASSSPAQNILTYWSEFSRGYSGLEHSAQEKRSSRSPPLLTQRLLRGWRQSLHSTVWQKVWDIQLKQWMEKILYHKDCKILEQAAPRGHGIAILEGFQDSARIKVLNDLVWIHCWPCLEQEIGLDNFLKPLPPWTVLVIPANGHTSRSLLAPPYPKQAYCLSSSKWIYFYLWVPGEHWLCHTWELSKGNSIRPIKHVQLAMQTCSICLV